MIDLITWFRGFFQHMKMCCKYCMMHGFKFSDPSVID